MSDLIARDNDSASLVAREESEPAWLAEPTVPAARVEVYRRDPDQSPEAALLVGSFTPGQEIRIDFKTVATQDTLFGTISYSADGVPSVLRMADVEWAPLVLTRESGDVPIIDAHVPTVTKPPTVAKVSAEELLVFTPAPDDNAGRVTDGEIRLRKADDLTELPIWPILDGPHHRVPQPAFDTLISYRWRNQSAEDDGNGRGWSDWSPEAAAAGSDTPEQPPPASAAVADFVYDEFDSRAGITRGVILS